MKKVNNWINCMNKLRKKVKKTISHLVNYFKIMRNSSIIQDKFFYRLNVELKD